MLNTPARSPPLARIVDKRLPGSVQALLLQPKNHPVLHRSSPSPASLLLLQT